ncbi:MAG: hypothetical protein CVU05_13795 [Bacteroidetes bacterium HGW-Bacteroidetes-21]|nr:MAG: hypothetical protein CVU05_13795 [Bacteroidetes bacterium HGW-Bacteroidetes-21]
MKKISILLFSLIYMCNAYSQVSTKYEKSWFENHSFKSQIKYNLAMDQYDVKFYDLNLEATNTSKAISGFAGFKAQVLTDNFNQIVAELHSSMVIDSIWVDDVLCTYVRNGNEFTVSLPAALNTDDYFTLKVFYHGSSTGGGISTGTSPSWQHDVTWTLSESYHALDWFPCKQSLTDKADSAWIFITCDDNLKVGSNGLLTQITPVNASQVRYEWKTHYPIDYYLISITISDYQEYNTYAHPVGYSDSILIQNYLYPNSNYLTQYQAIIDRTAEFIEFLSEKWGVYPFAEEKYGHCLAPFSGGMEHQTMTSLGYFNFELIIHELAHQWFGDYVTCSNWQDIWVNEGFATYSNYMGLEALETYSQAQSYMATMHSDIMSETGGSIYVPFAEINDEGRIFDYRLTYEKGAAILHMIRFMVDNDSLFYASYKNYLQQYAYSTASAEEFLTVLNSTTGMNFDSFFDEWYYGEGFPTYSINVWQQGDSLYFDFSQTSSSAITPSFSNPVEIKFNYSGGNTIIRYTPTFPEQTYSFYFPHQLTTVNIDPNNDIINAVGSINLNMPSHQISPFSIYPNPTKDQLTLQSDYLFDSYIVYDLSGKSLLEGTMANGATIIPLGDIPDGMYYIILKKGSDCYPAKFVRMK